MQEEWRDIQGYEGCYQVSNLGRVRSLDRFVETSRTKPFTVHGKILCAESVNGKCRVGLREDGKKTVHLHVEKLVAEAFVDNQDGYPDVIHVDGDVSNNNADNLAWGVSDTCYVFDSSKPEEWRDVVGYEGLYMVSNRGRVKSLSGEVNTMGGVRIKQETILKQTLNAYGYPQVALHKDGASQLRRTHRLVAEAFIPNPNDLPVVDHINAVRNDNNVENLRWVTTRENVVHACEMGHMDLEKLQQSSQSESAKKKRLEKISKAVVRNDGKSFPSMLAAATELGYKSAHPIRDVLNGVRETCKGYSFAYA